jgi:hypothetical protein
VLGRPFVAGDMMGDGVIPPLPLAAVRPLGLSRLSDGRVSRWQREHAGSGPHSIIEESWGVLREARMNLLRSP